MHCCTVTMQSSAQGFLYSIYPTPVRQGRLWTVLSHEWQLTFLWIDWNSWISSCPVHRRVPKIFCHEQQCNSKNFLQDTTCAHWHSKRRRTTHINWSGCLWLYFLFQFIKVWNVWMVLSSPLVWIKFSLLVAQTF